LNQPQESWNYRKKIGPIAAELELMKKKSDRSRQSWSWWKKNRTDRRRVGA